MSCRICKRSSCTESFHSIEEQEELEIALDDLKEKIRDKVLTAIRSTDGEWFRWNGERYFLDHDELINKIENLDL